MLKEGMFIQGRYEVVGRIGAGGMADVYKAKDHKLNRFVAVKVLKPEFRSDKVFITKFRAEAQAAAGLAHPNIVNIYDVGEDHGVNFIVMELVEGITLKEYIARKGRLAVREATSIAIQVSQGLEAAHNSGIVHRDVKPQNIIISTDGKVKVTDFGIARATSSNTISTAVMGSVHYSSPEQARGGYSDAKSDIYSLGITMYEMLTGHVPFDGDTTVAIAIKHLQEEMKSPEVYVPNLPRSTVQIIYKCTQKSPDRRYANMSELIYDLKESLVNPDGDFVHIVNANNAGQTVEISKEELGAIKEGYLSARINTGEIGTDETGNTGNTGGASAPGPAYPGAGYSGGHEQQPYDPYTYGRAYGKRGYDYQEEMENNSPAFQEDEEDDGILNPRLERLMTVGSIIIAILIAAIFLGLIANALGIIRFSLPSIFGSRRTTEKTTEVETSAQNQTDAAQTQSQEQQTQAQPQSQDAQSEQETQPAVVIETEGTEEDPLPPSQREPVAVPNVIYRDFETAQDLLMEAGFYVQRQDDESDEFDRGIVMDQSVTGTATPGTTVILIVSTGSADGSDGTWMCNAQLETAPLYNGELARLELVQGTTSKMLVDGQAITFPYNLEEEGVAGMNSGTVNLYALNAVTGNYDLIATYEVPFERVD